MTTTGPPVRWLEGDEDRELAALFALPLECPQAVVAAASRIRLLLELPAGLMVYGVNVAGQLPMVRIEIADADVAFEGHSVAELLEELQRVANELGELESPDELEERLEDEDLEERRRDAAIAGE